MCIDIVEIWFGIANWQTASILDRVICPSHVSGGALSFHVCIWSCLECSSENVPSPRKKTVYFNVKLSEHTTLDSLHVIVFDKVMGFRVCTTLLAIQHTKCLR